MDEVIYTFDDVINKAGCTVQILTELLEILRGKTVYGDRTINGYDSPPITFSERKIRPNLPIFTQLQYDYLVNIARKHQDKPASKQQSKPTYEQLEAEIIELKANNQQLKQQLDEANARILELEEITKQATKEISPKSKAPIAATFKAIKQIYPNLTIDNVLNQTQLNGEEVSRTAIANYLAGKI